MRRPCSTAPCSSTSAGCTGPPGWPTELRQWLGANARGREVFWRFMAENALRNEPPLGLLRDFALGEHGGRAGTLDIKVNGAALFVDAARILSCASGDLHTSTVERLRGAGEARRLDGRDVEAWVEAFHFIQSQRLSHQQARMQAGLTPDNFIDPDRAECAGSAHSERDLPPGAQAARAAAAGLPPVDAAHGPALAAAAQRKPSSEAALRARREWQSMSVSQLSAPLEELRWVAVDTETSGLDPRRDELISIGACAGQGWAINPRDSFEAMLRQDLPSGVDNVLVHGIGHAAQAAGEAPARALAAYLRYARRDVVVGYHTLFDRTVLTRAIREQLGIAYRPHTLDVALLLPALVEELASAGRDLDSWLQHVWTASLCSPQRAGRCLRNGAAVPGCAGPSPRGRAEQAGGSAQGAEDRGRAADPEARLAWIDSAKSIGRKPHAWTRRHAVRSTGLGARRSGAAGRSGYPSVLRWPSRRARTPPRHPGSHRVAWLTGTRMYLRLPSLRQPRVGDGSPPI